MLIVGILNSQIASLVARSGHMDEIIVCDAGFPIPLGVETIDLALSADHPNVLDVLAELVKYFAVEKVVMANETKVHSPSQFQKISTLLNGYLGHLWMSVWIIWSWHHRNITDGINIIKSFYPVIIVNDNPFSTAY